MGLPGYKEQLNSLKVYWCELVNNDLKLNGFDEKITHKSFKDRGIFDRIPQIKSYGNSDRIAINEAIKEYNNLQYECYDLHYEIYLENLKLEQEYQQYLEQIEPPELEPSPEPINLLQSDCNKFEHYDDETLGDNALFMAKFAAEDAAIEAEEKARTAYLSSQPNNRNNEPGL